MKLWQRIREAFSKNLTPEVSTYRHQFGNGIRVTITVDNWGRYQAAFSEPLSSWLWEEFDQWRDAVLQDHRKKTGVTISKRQLRNETAK